MAGDDQSDPFLWDEDRVVQELCTSNRSWKAPLAKRLPDPAALEAKLRDCGVDGESLLTYEDEFGFDHLWACLGVKKLPHQLSLKDAITQLRRRSAGYREWKTQQLANSQLCAEEDDGLAIKSEPYKPADVEHGAQLAPVSEPSPDSTGTEPRAAVPELTSSCQGVLSPALSPSADRDLPAASQVSEAQGSDQEASEEPPSKKRRIAPTTLSADTTFNPAFAIIPNEGDAFVGGRDTVKTVLQAGDTSGFLGAGTLRRARLLEPQTADPTGPVNQVFSLVPTQLPPGRRIQVAAAMKRFLRANLADRLKPSGDRDEEESEYGESDDGSVDSETWREYQEEEAERAAAEPRQDATNERLLSKEEVAEAVRIAIQELESRWMAEKKPGCDRVAFKKWQEVRRNPYRLGYIDSVKRELDHFVIRIANYSKQLIAQTWTVGNDVQRTASGILEASVFDKKHREWLIHVIESPCQPPKPSTLPRATPKRVKPSIPDDEELLTSDSDDMDAFIENDETAIPLVGDEMEIDSEPGRELATVPANPGRDAFATPGDGANADPSPARTTPSSEQAEDDLPSAPPTPEKIKVEQPLMPATSRRTATSPPEVVVIDSSPSPLKLIDQIPGLHDLDSLENIGDIGIKYWEKIEDAERLVVAVLCQWSRSKIVKIYGDIKDCDHTELWPKYMAPTLEDPDSATPDSVAFYLCRLFDVFVNTSATRIEQKTLRPNTCNRMKRKGDLFAGFCAFLKRVLPLFLGIAPQAPTRIVLKTPRKGSPSTPTPAEIQDPADEFSASEESSLDGIPRPSTKKRRRARRRDADAANLRIDNVKRNEVLARRTRELRERIALQGSVSSKHARLIVNETKESDDQSLIYINDHIGSKIKDHQIEGVRFMWNQVVVDSKVRQGCLLAHMMGLGKTMQVITLLVVIAESSASPDESVRSQIPENLRESRTLILCPPSLVDNWHDEIRMWAPDEVLGPIQRVDTVPSTQRMKPVHAWAASGGVLIVGYTMFTILVRDEAAAKILLEVPNLVIGDEAHYIKNPESQRHQATANFKTMNRIAMTGSPLTNNVMDYYAMINWVAPNYLADIVEFRDRFSNPIKEGLYADSEPPQKRRARRMLHVLKETVDPKVHRRDIEVLLHELPKKKEFIIMLPLTKVQTRLYKSYIEWVTDPSREMQMAGQAKAWSLVAKLGLVLAHPFIFKTVAEAQKAKPSGSKGQSSKAPRAGNAEEDDVEMPQDVLIRLLTATAIREIEDYALSNKILVLLQILDECKKVGDKVLVFSQSISTLDYIENIFRRQRLVYQRLDGHTPMSTRQDSVKKFNTGSECQVYLISTKAGGVGLNIYGANRVVIFDFRYSPSDEQQAIGRAYRLGQTKPVYVYWLTIGGTFEDTIHNNAVFKTQLASRVVDKKNPDPWSTRFAGAYFKMPADVEQTDLSGSRGQDRVLDALLQSEVAGKLIRKITSTETFEQEEAYELTPEERQEAEKDIEMERLRSQNPEEYKRREQEQRSQWRSMVGTVPLPPPGFYQPRPTDGESQLASQGTGNRSNRIVRIKVPEHMRGKREPGPPIPTVVSGTASAQLSPPSFPPNIDYPPQQVLTLTSAALVSPPVPFTPHPTTLATPAFPQSPPVQDKPAIVPAIPAPNQPGVNNALTQEPTPVPPPILAAGTHFKVPHTASPPSLLSGPPVLGSPGTPSAAAAAAQISESDFPDLRAVHKKLSQEGRHVRHHPSDVLNRVQGVWTRNKVEQLPMMDKIQNMKKCSRNPRFAEAMLSGYMEPEQLASLTRPEMEEISASLNGLAEGEFRQRVWTTKADFKVCTDTKSI
ncbi:hypothetical protein C8A01DRAFT_12521 [Parachaetomium inaequale]|uniref:Uncharacterized protein n=1 Tax=Parachaetomium inaequale TaxID=2588326 RepID=A0AAN6PT06_9PEZI|nr:hypothetical protein C8A01DRAFT_12521 [Parachaetomium inaequale]